MRKGWNKYLKSYVNKKVNGDIYFFVYKIPIFSMLKNSFSIPKICQIIKKFDKREQYFRIICDIETKI